ncbi:O-methyltransferase [Thermaurantiacus sp.]
MTGERFAAVDHWIARHLIPDDPVLEAVLKSARTNGLPAIDVSPLLGAFLALVAHLIKARRILEIGTLAGYSAIWMARALPQDGHLVTIEVNPRTADVARANFARADVVKRIDLRVGAALDVLPTLVDEGHAFDMAFIDADKANNASYADWAATLVRPGGVVIIDNVVRDGRILDEATDDPDIVGTRSLYAAMRMDGRFESTALQTVGVKGWDGLLIARRR